MKKNPLSNFTKLAAIPLARGAAYISQVAEKEREFTNLCAVVGDITKAKDLSERFTRYQIEQITLLILRGEPCESAVSLVEKGINYEIYNLLKA